MRRVSRHSVPLALALTIAFSGLASAADAPPNPLRIEVDGGADVHGEIVFTFAEDGQDIARIPVAIPKGTPENNVARRIRKELRRALPKSGYQVDLDDGEKVLVSPRSGTGRFSIRLERNSVTGTEISIARE